MSQLVAERRRSSQASLSRATWRGGVGNARDCASGAWACERRILRVCGAHELLERALQRAPQVARRLVRGRRQKSPKTVLHSKNIVTY